MNDKIKLTDENIQTAINSSGISHGFPTKLTPRDVYFLDLRLEHDNKKCLFSCCMEKNNSGNWLVTVTPFDVLDNWITEYKINEITDEIIIDKLRHHATKMLTKIAKTGIYLKRDVGGCLDWKVGGRIKREVYFNITQPRGILYDDYEILHHPKRFKGE